MAAIGMYPDEAEGAKECCAVGPGGSSVLTNNNEEKILDESCGLMRTRAEGMQEPGRH